MRWLLCGQGKLCSTTLQGCHKAEQISYCGSSSGLTKPSLRFAHGTPWGQMRQAWSSLEQSHNWPASPWLLAILYSEPRPFKSSRCPRWKSKFPRNGDPLTFSHTGYKWLMFPKNRGVSNNRCSSFSPLQWDEETTASCMERSNEDISPTSTVLSSSSITSHSLFLSLVFSSTLFSLVLSYTCSSIPSCHNPFSSASQTQGSPLTHAPTEPGMYNHREGASHNG